MERLREKQGKRERKNKREMSKVLKRESVKRVEREREIENGRKKKLVLYFSIVVARSIRGLDTSPMLCIIHYHS